MSLVEIEEGSTPLVLGLPHTGTFVPDDLVNRMTKAGQGLEDTDWHVHELYAFARDLGASTVRTTVSRYVIDCNRDPSGASLYPGQATTELCPTTTFAGEPIWKTPPTEEEIERRRTLYFEPYHRALALEIARVKGKHGFCLLYDCHSIKSTIPRLFPGELPTLNLGTNSGASCAPSVEAAAAAAMARSGLSHIVNGRFKGGWITRHYGQPDAHVHAIQMEIALCAYLAQEAPPWEFDDGTAAPLIAALDDVIESAMEATAASEGKKP